MVINENIEVYAKQGGLNILVKNGKDSFYKTFFFKNQDFEEEEYLEKIVTKIHKGYLLYWEHDSSDVGSKWTLTEIKSPTRVRTLAFKEPTEKIREERIAKMVEVRMTEGIQKKEIKRYFE